MNEWVKEFPGAVTVSDIDGNIIEMNDKACKTFENNGGKNLIGSSLFDCHMEESNKKIRELLAGGEPNVYTIEKNGVKKLIFQTPWFTENKIMGVVELSLEIPFEMPHFIRK